MLRFLRNIVFVFILAVTLPVSTAVAQSGSLIQVIRVEGMARIEAETVRSYLKLRVGGIYSAGLVNQSQKSLFETGLFADVVITERNGIVTVRVKENPIISQIVFEGNKRLEDAILDEIINLRPRVVYTAAKVRADVDVILQAYQRSGRFATSVNPKIIRLSQNRVNLIFEINEGQLTTVKRIDILGNREFSDGRLRGKILTEEDSWYSFLSTMNSYDPDRLVEDQQAIRRYYRNNGFADVRVLAAVAELSRNREHFFITFTVEEGIAYKFGKIKVTSTLKELDLKKLDATIETEEGDIYDADEMEETVENISFAVGRLGFAFVEVRRIEKRDLKKKTIDVTYEIREGRKAYVERINIAGNVRTLDTVIRRQFRIGEGDAFNSAQLRSGARRVRRLGYFEDVKMSRRPGTRPDSLIVDVAVKERSTGSLNFGLGISTAETAVATIGIRERNLLGKGQDLKLTLEVSAVRTEIDLSFTEPYFLQRDLSAGFDLFRIEREFRDTRTYDIDSTGGVLRLGYALAEDLRHRLSYSLRKDEISNVNSFSSPFIRANNGSTLTSMISHTVTFDNRDARFSPTEGWLATITQDLAGIGGDAYFLRTTSRLSWYTPITENWVLGLTGRSGYVMGLDQNVGVNARYFLGGGRFRGFEAAGVGPRDGSTGESIGGNIFYTTTAEVRFPLTFSDTSGLYGRIFSVAGSLWEVDSNGFSSSDKARLLGEDAMGIRMSVGFGLSWNTQFGPLRFDFTDAFIEKSYDKTQFFRFSFGTSF